MAHATDSTLTGGGGRRSRGARVTRAACSRSGRGAAVVAGAAFVLRLVLPAGAQDVPVTGFIPPDDATAKAASSLLKAGSKGMKAIGKCHSKVISSLAKGGAFDEASLNACIDKASAKFKEGTSGILGPSGILPNALNLAGGTADSAVDEFNTRLMRAMGSLACCGTVPLPGDYSGTIPNAFDDSNCTFKKQNGVAKGIEKYADSLSKCHKKYEKSVRDAFNNGQPRPSKASLQGCEKEALADLRFRISVLRPLPACVESNLGLSTAALAGRQSGSDVGTTIVADIRDSFPKYTDQVLSEGTEPVDLSGCCERGSSCSQVASQASCSSGSFFRGQACSANGRCEPSNCPFGPDDGSLNCGNCPELFGACTPTPGIPTPTPRPTFDPNQACCPGPPPSCYLPPTYCSD